jgi:hypothetical protein
MRNFQFLTMQAPWTLPGTRAGDSDIASLVFSELGLGREK